MDMVFVRQERIAAVAHPVQVDPHYVAAGDEQGREKADHEERVVDTAFRRFQRQQFETEESEHHADGKAACVAHEDLPLFFGVAEYIIIIEGDEYAQCGEREHGIDVLPAMEEHDSVDQQGDAAQTGSQTVDAVDEVDGIDQEDD